MTFTRADLLFVAFIALGAGVVLGVSIVTLFETRRGRPRLHAKGKAPDVRVIEEGVRFVAPPGPVSHDNLARLLRDLEEASARAEKILGPKGGD